MNVYDFDGTIYGGDSTIDFFLFAVKNKPTILLYLPKQFWGFILYALKLIDKTTLKEYFFEFLPEIDAERLSESFWKKNKNKIYAWYLKQQSPEDIVISASPEFLLKPVCKSLGVKNLIASKVDAHTGKFSGKNCHGQEKVCRLASEKNITHINKFYSDSRSDLPLAMIADKAYLVKNGTIQEWKGVTNDNRP